MRRIAQKAVVTALGFSLVIVPLAGCNGGGTTSKPSTGAEEQVEESVEGDEGFIDHDARTPTGNPDYNTWSTLGDAFDAATSDPSYGVDENYYLGTIPVEDRTIYVIARMTSEAYAAFNDAFDDNAAAEAAIAAMAIEYKADISDEVLSQAELDAYVGKTGQELLDAGFIFQGYSMYGGDETMATFDKGFYSYEVTFPVKVEEDMTEDGGASLLDASASAVDSYGNTGNLIYSPTEFTQVPELASLGFEPSPGFEE